MPPSPSGSPPHRRASEPGGSTTGKTRLPESLRRFVERQTTVPVADLWKRDPEDRRSPYGSYWYRAVACMLLSGRVQPKADGDPNMTDVNRVGKEANFNQYLTERIGKLLVAAGAVRVDHRGKYEAGPNLAAIWEHDVGRLPAIPLADDHVVAGEVAGHDLLEAGLRFVARH